jgi:hypothetical protein
MVIFNKWFGKTLPKFRTFEQSIFQPLKKIEYDFKNAIRDLFLNN